MVRRRSGAVRLQWDVYRSDRFVKSVRVITFKDVNVEELSLPKELALKELQLPKELALDE